MEIQGCVYFDYGAPAPDLPLRFYHRLFGGDGILLGEVNTDGNGEYVFTCGPAPVSLEVRAVGEDDSEISLTEQMCGVPPEPLNLVVPAELRPLASEYQRITTDMRRNTAGGSLGSAREDEERRDLSLLHCATRWDARLIALAAIADRLSEVIGVSREALYGMMRVGLPTELMQLARVGRAAVGHALRTANEAGITDLSDQDIEAAQQKLDAFARGTRRRLAEPGTLSSYGDMLAASGLTAAQQDQFDEIFAGHTGGGDQLWDNARDAGLPVEPLRLTASLGFLTLNNADLVTALRGDVDDLRSLVKQRLYQPDTWSARLRAMAADEDALAELIPPAYTGTTTDERLAAYCADLARKVRRSYPTQVISDMVDTNQLDVGDAAVKSDVVTVLNRATEVDGFSLGRTPLGAFVRDHGSELLGGIPPERAAAAVRQVKTLHRLYQITPHDEALKVLLDRGFTSAYDVVAMPREMFVRRVGDDLITTEQANTIYQKARQVTTVIYSFFAAAKQIEHAPPVHALSAPPEVVESAKDNLIKHYPTMESLFGSLDHTDCEHCRSVLSPAAYLVDLLRFLDPDQHVWEAIVEDWLDEHPGGATPKRPFDLLDERRPDLQALPLTCENTHTPLPYIDIVNEILEYYLVNGDLDPNAAHDTGTANSADLIAEPRHLLPDAYEELRNARYPLTLPFNLWLETVRRFGEHFDTPLWQVLDALRTDETLDGHRPVFLERLGISPEEHAILTMKQPTAWFELYGHPNAQTALTELRSAKTLSRRLGVGYRELVAVLRTGFVNPRLETLVELRRFGVDVEDALRYLGAPGHPAFDPAEKAAFAEKLTDDGVAWLHQKYDAGDFATILVIAGSNAGGTVQYANGNPVDPTALLTVNLFVRLWRRLGWSIEETGRALRTFLPGAPGSAIGPAMDTALLGIAHYDTLSTLLRTGAKDRPKLTLLWSDLDDVTYAELFLTGSEDTRDPAFHDDSGHYLTAGSPLREHLPGVRAALNLTTEEIGRILAGAGLGLETATLDLPTVSLLHRYGLLAGWMRLPVDELITLEELSGLRPFTPLHAGPVQEIDQDYPFTRTQRFVEVASAVRDSGLSIADLDYLLRHRFDPVGPHRAAAEPPLGLVRALSTEITRIRGEHAIPADPLAFTDEMLQQKLALVFPPDVVATFLGMWRGTVEYVVTAPIPTAPDLPSDHHVLAQEDFTGTPAISVRHDAVRDVQTLVYQGVLREVDREALLDRYTKGQKRLRDDRAEMFTWLLDKVRPTDFFARHLRKTDELGAVTTGFLSEEDFATLFVPRPDELGEPAQQTRRATLVAAFLPYLRGRLVQQLVVQAVAADLGTEPELARALVTEPTLVDDDPDAPGAPLLTAYTAITEPSSLDGYLEVPASGAYRFFVHCEQAGTTVALRFDHLADPLLHATTPAGGTELSEYTTLPAGTPLGFTITADKPGVTVSVQGELLPKGALTDTLTTWSRAAVTRLHRAHLLLGKVIQLADALDLTEPELRHMSVHHDDFDGLDLGALPTEPGQDDAPQTEARFRAVLRLAAYTRLRDDLAAGPGELIDLFASARRTYPAGDPDAEQEVLADLCARLAGILRRDPAVVEAAAGLLGVKPAQLTDEQCVRRLWTMLALASRFGVAPDALDRWATPNPDAAIAQDLRDTVKANYGTDRWRSIARSIFDVLRQRRRDALVAYIMHTKGFDRVEQLFEHFLIDPATESVVLTSRLRLAISSVQTFIQRCLLNLEPGVSPSFLDSAQWQWKKRYRVWEANRKIFLWPENFLEPEFMDVKSHLFTQLESAMLEGDLAAEHVENAFHAYLRGLEEIARLDVRAIHLEEKPDPAANVLHVVARTFGMPFRYFYRTYAHQMWTPWVPVTTDIQGDHLVVTVWRGRVHLFWVSFLEKSAKDIDTDKKPDQLMDTKLKEIQPPRWVEVQVSWAEYFQGEWTNPASTGYQRWQRQEDKSAEPPVFDPASAFVHATTADDGAVWIHLNNPGYYSDYSIRIISKNGPASVGPRVSAVRPPYTGVTAAGGGRYTGQDEEFSVTYVEQITTKNGKTTYSCPTSKQILRQADPYTLVTQGEALHGPPEDIGPLVSPFFYADGQHTFYVEPKLTEETTVAQGAGFVLTIPVTLPHTESPDHWAKVVVGAQVSGGLGRVDVSPAAKYTIQSKSDWVTRAGNLVPFDATLIGVSGGVAASARQGGES